MKIALKSPRQPEWFLESLSVAAIKICKEHQLGGQSWKSELEQNLMITDSLGASDLELVFEKDLESKGIVVKFDSRDDKRVKQIMGWLCESYASLFEERFEMEW